MLKVDYNMAETGVAVSEIEKLSAEAERCNNMLARGNGAGADFLGWVNLPSSITDEQLHDIQAAADRLRSVADLVLVIGIGGSYLGARAVLEALSEPFGYLRHKRNAPHVVFAGQNISEDYLHNLLEAAREYSIGAIVISKSETTTEPAIAFRLIRDEIEARYGKQSARERIIAVTDRARGALKSLSDTEGYRTFVIPDNVGGRYSVLTPVGLLPLAVAGTDIAALVAGAREMEAATAENIPFAKNPAAQYAAARNALYRKGYKVEILGSYEPSLQYIGEWWKQLYGESEGKGGRGIFPASVTLTADLHSMGQYIQEGERMLMETIISVAKPNSELHINADSENLDGLNFLSGKRLSDVNHMAEAGVLLAHCDGGVPNLRIVIDRVDAHSIGALLYFFERACGISGYMLGVNPFDQPGVEAYKKNMFALLDKPGYEEEGCRLRARLAGRTGE